MSYDVTFLRLKHMPEYPNEEWRNYTSNVSPMWYEALGGVTLGDLIDRSATNSDLIQPLRAAIASMLADSAKYRAMNPPNGWGDYQGARDYLQWMLDMAEAVPDGTCEVWR